MEPANGEVITIGKAEIAENALSIKDVEGWKKTLHPTSDNEFTGSIHIVGEEIAELVLVSNCVPTVE